MKLPRRRRQPAGTGFAETDGRGKGRTVHEGGPPAPPGRVVNPVLRRTLSVDPEVTTVFKEIEALLVREAKERGSDARLLGLGIDEHHVTVVLRPGEEALAEDLRAMHGDVLIVQFGFPAMSDPAKDA